MGVDNIYSHISFMKPYTVDVVVYTLALKRIEMSH